MTKMLIDINEETLTRAAELLKTKTKKDTVNTALEETIARLERAEALIKLREMTAEGALDLELLKDKRNYRR
ncbi:type II toxin-antitoxin system VapB family antitoxin [Nocardiopsis composta]|uniref:Arc/MetJ family transcription regulator n=1 Tax=Nocardiopsis composta TaxID=157465 RepID=A0A7W8VGR1_9ACTN|nr:type II toxin-antitoxin system VapB family antitoxin [Nocardiopsis composta]MBB5435415.1 Arc/MetJ family transcription regulator [Nocardiopsis composta]